MDPSQVWPQPASGEAVDCGQMCVKLPPGEASSRSHSQECRWGHDFVPLPPPALAPSRPQPPALPAPALAPEPASAPCAPSEGRCARPSPAPAALKPPACPSPLAAPFRAALPVVNRPLPRKNTFYTEILLSIPFLIPCPPPPHTTGTCGLLGSLSLPWRNAILGHGFSNRLHFGTHPPNLMAAYQTSKPHLRFLVQPVYMDPGDLHF